MAGDISIPLDGLYDRIRDAIKGVGNQRELGEYLWRISELLNDIDQKLSLREIPVKESRELAILISAARTQSERFKTKVIDLRYIFDEALPEIGRLLRDADFFIDGNPGHYDIDRRTKVYEPKKSAEGAINWTAIQRAQKEMQRTIGALLAIARILRFTPAAPPNR